jgi:hypothetical protein
LHEFAHFVVPVTICTLASVDAMALYF